MEKFLMERILLEMHKNGNGFYQRIELCLERTLAAIAFTNKSYENEKRVKQSSLNSKRLLSDFEILCSFPFNSLQSKSIFLVLMLISKLSYSINYYQLSSVLLLVLLLISVHLFPVSWQAQTDYFNP